MQADCGAAPPLGREGIVVLVIKPSFCPTSPPAVANGLWSWRSRWR